ncbi:MAG: hypothetical protein ABSF98_20630 [Bryobacteraceae bacterium]
MLTRTVERIERMTNLVSNDRRYFIELVRRAANIEGVESVFKRINERDDDMAVDHLMEIRYGVVFRDLGFSVRFEPTGPKGPDLRVTRDGVSAFVEVKRYRPKNGEDIPDSFGPHGTLSAYGDAAEAQTRMAKDLLDKISQIEPRNGVEHGILTLWSDREFFEELEFECAVRQISPEARQKGLRFCVFGSDYVNQRCQQRFYCEPVGLLPAPLNGWMEDLRRAR